METLTIIGVVAIAIVAVRQPGRGRPAHSTYRLGRPPAGVRAVSPRLEGGASPVIFGPGAFPQLTGTTSLGTLHTWSGTVGAWGGGTPIGFDVPPGDYEVRATLDEGHVAYLSLHVADGTVDHYELAYGLGPGGFRALSVDDGIVMFTDVETELAEDYIDPLLAADGLANIDGQIVIVMCDDGQFPVVEAVDADGALLAVHICLLVLPDQLEVFEQESVPIGSPLAVLPYAD